MTGANPFLEFNLDPKMILLKKGFVSETHLQSRRMERSIKPFLPLLAALLLAPLAGLCATGNNSVSHPANVLEAGETAARQKAVLTHKDVLSIRDRCFYLDSKPFAEISFNKFDLFWQLYDQLTDGKPLTDDNPKVQAQARALRNLHELGFQSIRIFGLPWGPAGPAAYADPSKRERLYAAIDKTLELCDRHGIRLVWCLAAAEFTDTRLVPGKGWVFGDEQLRELVADRNSRGRRLLYRYLDETVSRYQNRKTILMWEISNELTLNADIGDDHRVYAGQRMPTLKDVAGFYDDVARRIKASDPLRLVSNGGSGMREHQWHLYQRQGWILDTFAEQLACCQLLFANSAVDVMDIHFYPNNQPGQIIRGDNARETILGCQGYMAIAERIGKPLMIGELGLTPAAKADQKTWAATTNYFESYANAAAALPWVRRTLDNAIEAGVQLVYWWSYQSDREQDQRDPQRFDLELERNPELIKAIVEANQRLKRRRASP